MSPCVIQIFWPDDDYNKSRHVAVLYTQAHCFYNKCSCVHCCTRVSQKVSEMEVHVVQLVKLLVGHDAIRVVYLSPTVVVHM
jgi:hypothetical protein